MSNGGLDGEIFCEEVIKRPIREGWSFLTPQSIGVLENVSTPHLNGGGTKNLSVNRKVFCTLKVSSVYFFNGESVSV